MSMIQKIDARAMSGIGSGILYKNPSGKFSVLALTDKVPSVKGERETISTGNTMSDTETMIEGIVKLEKVTFEVYHGRDSRRFIDKLEGKVLELISFSGDYTGERYSGTVSYKTGDAENGNAQKATITVTPNAYIGYVDNIVPLYQPTAVFENVPAMIKLDAVVKDYTLDVSVSPSGATVTALSETPSIATATLTNGKLSIKGVAKGSCIIVLKGSGEDIAEAETTIHVTVDSVSAT